MQKDKVLEYAGRLADEINETENLIQEEESIEMAVTHTLKCGLFMTIYCC